MAKEKKSGELTNEEIEQELERTGKSDKSNRPYVGSQDTGDDIVREYGNEIQKRDGLSLDKEEK